jgi:hypothetical protein
MTKREAKELCLEVWGYLRDHPDVEDMEDLPQELYNLVRDLECKNPLCELFTDCTECFLYKAGECCNGIDPAYLRWRNAPHGRKGNAKRCEAAGRMYDITKAWEV